MDYTKNYHLPQWVREDRILMEDFNDAMANIEKGIISAAAGAESSVRKEVQTVATAQTASDQRELARLRRLAYDLCQVNARSLAAARFDAITHTKGLAFNGLATGKERARTSGFFLPADRPGGWLGPDGGLTVERLNAAASNFVTASVTSTFHTATASVDLDVLYDGTLTQVGIWFHQQSALNVQAPVQINLFDKDENRYPYTSDAMTTDMIRSTIYAPMMMDVKIPLKAGHHYRLELVLLRDNLIMGRFGFGEEDEEIMKGSVEPAIQTHGTVTETLALESPAVVAVGVVHLNCTESETQLQLQVNGKNMALAATRQTIDVRGAACMEKEFYLEGSWSETVTLAANVESTRNLYLEDVEWYLI